MSACLRKFSYLLLAVCSLLLTANVAVAQEPKPTQEFLMHVSEGGRKITRGSIYVDTDFLKPVRLNNAIGNLVIGNPFIADVIPRDDKYLFINGKSAGHTGMLVYDKTGNLVGEYMIYVRSSQQYTLLMNGAKRRSHFACTPNCERVLRIEDSPDETGELAGRITTVRGLIAGEAEKAKAGDAPASARR